MRKHFTKKRVALLAGLTVAASLAVAGYAYFTSTGTGSGSASVGTSTAWEVTTDAASGGPMTPGGGSGTYETVAYHVKNNNTGQQNLANVNIKVANSDGTPWTAVAGCSKDDFELSADGTTWAAAGAAVDDTEAAGNMASGATNNGTFKIRMKDTGSNQDGCKTATIPLYLYAS